MSPQWRARLVGHDQEPALTTCGKTIYAMVSAAKHRVLLILKKEKQILRCAQDDMKGTFFRSLLSGAKDGCATTTTQVKSP
jgi:hypothetical protein